MLSVEMIKDAQKVLQGIVRYTPLISMPKLDENLEIKPENLQKTGSFKLRGAYYKMSKLNDEERKNGVVACSAGNHAQGVAYAAAKNGIKSVICIPAGAPLSKVENTRSYGSEVVLVSGVYDDAYAKAVQIQKEEKMTFLHPFDDEYVIAGQGTVGLEILEQMPDVDIVVVPIGGGGLISGIAYAIKSLKPDCKIYGVQAEGAPSMLNSINNNEIRILDEVSTIADGIAVKRPGNLTFELCRKYVDKIVTVSEDEIATAILTLIEQNKTVSEGAGAVSVAAVMFNKIDIKGKKVVCVVSGGNIDVNIVSRVITKGLLKTGRLVEFMTKVIDKPGHLITLLQLISDSGANIISIDHERQNAASEVGSCAVKMVMETTDEEHKCSIFSKIAEAGYELF